MALIYVKCPYCSKVVEVDDEDKVGYCDKCQEEFMIKDALIDDEDAVLEAEENYDTDETGNLVTKASKQFIIEDNILVKYKGLEKVVNVPDGVREIAKFVFSGMDDIEKVNLPNSVEFIGECAFEGCINLKEINFPMRLRRIDNDAFDGCAALEKLEFPEECYLEEIGESAFVKCVNLVFLDIPENVVKIEANAFSQCKRLWQIKFRKGSKLKVIEENVFSKCSNILQITLPANLEVIEKNVFYGCNMLAIIDFEENSKLQTIGRLAFDNLESLKTLVIPKTVMNVGEQAFKDCPKLMDIKIEEPSMLQSIGKAAFADCLGLKKINIPDGVLTISASAFENCRNLTDVEVASSVIVIEDKAFSGCVSLSNINFASGSKLERIGTSVFENCESLEKIHLDSDRITFIGPFCFAKCDKLRRFEIPENLEMIQNDTFRACRKLETVEFSLGKKLKRICENAFYWCTSLYKVDIPNTVKVIEGHAFEGCVGIEKIRIPRSVTEIGSKGISGNNIFLDFYNPEIYPDKSIVSKWPKDWYEDYNTNIVYREYSFEDDDIEPAKPQVESKKIEHINEAVESSTVSPVVKPTASPAASPSTKSPNEQKSKFSLGENNFEPKKKGCYVATAVYGSYNCNEVYVLRRYRDFTLSKNIFGRMFIKTYYFISPKLIKVFKNNILFKKICKNKLDSFVSKLIKKGYSDLPYND